MFLFWHQAPVVRIVIPFILGILLGFGVPEPFGKFPVYFAIAGILIALLIGFKRKWKDYHRKFTFSYLVIGVIFFLGASHASYHWKNRQFESHFSGAASTYLAEISAFPDQSRNSTRVEIEVLAITDSLGNVRGTRSRLLAYFPFAMRADTLVPGDFVTFLSPPEKVKPPLNPGQFDFGTYLFNSGFIGTVYISKNVGFLSGPDINLPLSFRLQVYREDAIEIFREFGFDDRELGVVSALILGKRQLVDSDLREAYAGAGTVHILAVSGLHVGIIYLFMNFLLSRLFPGKKMRFIRLLLTLCFLWLYAGITGFSPSVMRAATMFSFIAMGKHQGRYVNIYNMLAASALLLLIIDPFLIRQVGFQLSYLAVIGIVFLHPKIYPWLATGRFLPDKIWSLFVVSIVAQLATFPLSVFYFHQFPNLFFINNLAVIPLATIILYAGISGLLLCWIPYLSDIIFMVIRGCTWLLNEFIIFMAQLPYAITTDIVFSGRYTILIYGFIVIVIMAIKNPRPYLRGAWGLGLILAFSYGSNTIQNALSTTLTCLHADKETVIVSRRGYEATIWSSVAENERQSVGFQLDGYMQSLQPRNVQWAQLNLDKDYSEIHRSCMIIFNGSHTLLVAGSPNDLNAVCGTEIDAILLIGKFRLTSDIAKECFAPQTVFLIDGSVPFYHRPLIEESLREAGLQVWDTSVNGAFSIEKLTVF